MPNYCQNTLKIIAKDDVVKTIIDMMRGTGEDEGNLFDFNKVIPMPENIYRGDINKEKEALYGKNNWYDWSIENWGTKWNSVDAELRENCFVFDTAWSPCLPVIRKLAEMFPEARFEYWYEELGMCFCGHEIYENGKVQYAMEADIEGHYNDDECKDPLFDDYKEGREDEIITSVKIVDGVKRGKIVRREDRDDFIRLIQGTFVKYDNNTKEIKEPALR